MSGCCCTRLRSTSPAGSWLTWVFAFVFYDFCYYWQHRLGHTVGLFWATHSVHHQSEEFNLTTALRQPGTGAFTNWIFYVPMALCGVPVSCVPADRRDAALLSVLAAHAPHRPDGHSRPLDPDALEPSRASRAKRYLPGQELCGRLPDLGSPLRHVSGGARRRAVHLRRARPTEELESGLGQPALLVR